MSETSTSYANNIQIAQSVASRRKTGLYLQRDRRDSQPVGLMGKVVTNDINLSVIDVVCDPFLGAAPADARSCSSQTLSRSWRCLAA